MRRATVTGVAVLGYLVGALARAAGATVAGPVGGHVGGSASVTGHCLPVWNGFRRGEGWPNLWGTKPGPGLPLAAAVSGSVIAYKFLAAK